MSDRKFYKTVITVTVLSEDEPLDSNLDLEGVHDSITGGDCSGEVTWADPVLLTGAEAAAALKAQGSDPCFFRLNPDGSEADE